MNGAIRSEFRKIFTTRLWWGMAIGVVVVGGGLAAVLGGLAGQGEGQNALPALDQPGMVTTVYTAGLSLAYLLTLAIGVMLIGAEYRHKTITATFLSTPRRVHVMLAKVVALLGIGAFYGVLFCLSSVGVGATVITLRGFDPFPAGEHVWRTLALSLLALGLWALIGLGAGILISNQVAALLISIGIAWIGQSLMSLAFLALHWTTANELLPANATNAMVSGLSRGFSGESVDQLSWWGGALVLAAYAAVLAGVGSFLTVRRDVT